MSDEIELIATPLLLCEVLQDMLCASAVTHSGSCVQRGWQEGRSQGVVLSLSNPPVPARQAESSLHIRCALRALDRLAVRELVVALVPKYPDGTEGV